MLVGYFRYVLGMMSCIAYEPCLVNILICIYDITLTSVILRELHNLRADLTRLYIYIYKLYVFVKHKYVQMTIFLPNPFL